MSKQSRGGGLLEKEECKELYSLAMSAFCQASDWPKRKNCDWNPQWLSFPRLLLMGGQENCLSIALVFKLGAWWEGEEKSVRGELRLAVWFLGWVLQCQPRQRVQPARPSTVTRALLKRLIGGVEGGEPKHCTDENKCTCFECGCSVKKVWGGDWSKKSEAEGEYVIFLMESPHHLFLLHPDLLPMLQVLSLTSAEWRFYFSTSGQECNHIMKIIVFSFFGLFHVSWITSIYWYW